MRKSRFWTYVMPILLLLALLAIPCFVVLDKMGFFTPAPTAQVTMTAAEDAPELVFVADYDYDPYSYLNEDGSPNGMDVEIAYELANRLDMRPRIEFGTWGECKEKIKNQEADVLLGLEIFVDGTSTGTLKSIPVGNDTLSIIGFNAIDDAAALSGKKVGVSFGSALMDLFKLNCEYVQFFTYSEMFEALNNKEIDYGICHASVAIRLIEKNGYDFAPSLVLMESFPTLGIRQDEPELQTKINRTLEEMSADGTIAALREKWIETNVKNRTVADVLHNNEGFFITYGILAIALFTAYIIAVTLIRSSEVRKNSLELANSANMAKTEFLFNMSHDIRTPMNAIVGFTDKAIRNKDNPKVLEESLDKVKTSSSYLLKIINDILDMAKIESGKLNIKEQLNYIEDGHKIIVEMFGSEAAAKNISFIPSLDIKDKYLWFDGDHTLQIISNLLSNAIKYTEAGGEVKYAVKQIPCEREGYARIAITVEDNGVGMSQEFLGRIYDAFEREQTATKSGVQGTGLGMTIVKRLSDAMGCSIEIESQQGVGTTVTLTAENRIATSDEIEEFRSQINDSLRHLETGFVDKRILVVEDNELNREIAVDLLENEGLIVEEAQDGDEAVEMVKKAIASGNLNYYDAILMDVQMPRMNGYEATKAIRASSPEGLHIPIIAMTANAFEEDKQNALDSGMDEHVAKPIDIQRLFDVLSRYI